MSLIVQVNSGGGAGAAAPPQSNATPTATPVVVATTPSPAAEPPILQNSLATLVAAAEQQQQQQKLQQQNVLQVGGVAAQRITAASLSPAHLVQHHPPPLRMVQISAPPPTVALPTAPAPIRHALPQSPVGRPLPQLPRSPLKQNQLQAVQRTVVQHQARPPISPVTVSFITRFFPCFFAFTFTSDYRLEQRLYELPVNNALWSTLVEAGPISCQCYPKYPLLVCYLQRPLCKAFCLKTQAPWCLCPHTIGFKHLIPQVVRRTFCRQLS